MSDVDSSSSPSSNRPLSASTPLGMKRLRSDSSARLNAPNNSIVMTPNTPCDDSVCLNSSYQWCFTALSDNSYGVTSEQGHRKTMEDQHAATTGGAIPFFAVYDGHGGTACADFLRDNLQGYIIGHPNVEQEPERAISEGIARAEEEFLKICREQKVESGSTAAVALITHGNVVVGNVGDSEAILSRNGVPLLLTTKHHLSVNKDEAERIRAVGGRIHRDRVGHPKFNPSLVSLAVTRAVGDAGFKLDEFTDGKPSGVIATAATKTVPLVAEDEFLVIGCDGLWDVMTYADVVFFCRTRVTQGLSSQSITEELVSEALRLGSTDNITVLFVALRKDIEVLTPKVSSTNQSTEEVQLAAPALSNQGRSPKSEAQEHPNHDQSPNSEEAQ